MNESKHYIIIDTLNEILNQHYKYNVDSGTFSSDISKATQRTYEESEKMLISIYFHRPSMVRKCVIENFRKIKLQELNKIINGKEIVEITQKSK